MKVQTLSRRVQIAVRGLAAVSLVVVGAACAADEEAGEDARSANVEAEPKEPAPIDPEPELATPAEEPAAPADDPAPAEEVAEETEEPTMTEPTEEPATPADPPAMEVATLGAGCFWCIEAVLDQIEGVESVVSGYTGGQTENPTYKDICTGTTGHAEVVKVTFDPSVITYAEVLDWFWKLHDPTTLNRQGPDRGTQYRSAIFVHSEEQRRIAETSKRDVQPSFADPIVTEITDAVRFYPAEDYHQDYYFNNQNQRYCRGLITPKLKKLGLKY